jgi:hypothetical protein
VLCAGGGLPLASEFATANAPEREVGAETLPA